jgi:hypothetical protein
VLLANPLGYDAREEAKSFSEAYARASELTHPPAREPDICGWCRPDKMH